MNCEDIQSLLTLYLLGDLDKESAVTVREHIETCDGCRAAVREIEPTLDLLRDALAAPSEVPERLSIAHRDRIVRASAPPAEARPGLVDWVLQPHPRLAFAAGLVAVVGVVAALLMPAATKARRKAKAPESTLARLEVNKAFEVSVEAPEVSAVRNLSGASADIGDYAAGGNFVDEKFRAGGETPTDEESKSDVGLTVPADSPRSLNGSYYRNAEADPSGEFRFRAQLDSTDTDEEARDVRGFSHDQGKDVFFSDGEDESMEKQTGEDRDVYWGGDTLPPPDEPREGAIEENINGRENVPVLGDIPIAGRRFKETESESGKKANEPVMSLGLHQRGDKDSDGDEGREKLEKEKLSLGLSDELQHGIEDAQDQTIIRGIREHSASDSDGDGLSDGWETRGGKGGGGEAVGGIALDSVLADSGPSLSPEKPMKAIDGKRPEPPEPSTPGPQPETEPAMPDSLEELKRVDGLEGVLDDHSDRATGTVDDNRDTITGRASGLEKPPTARNELSLVTEDTKEWAGFHKAVMKHADITDKAKECKPQTEDETTGPRFKAFGVNRFFSAAVRPFSTFSIDVDTAAYTLARNYMSRGHLPPAESVRTEEFVNFFDYQYKPPEHGTFKVYAECAPSRFGRGLHLLKIGVKGRRIGREEQRPAVMTFLIDTSGSMDQPDRLGLVQKSLRMLIEQLAPQDKVAIVQYDSHARLVLGHTLASKKDAILAAIDGLQCSGSTNLEEGMDRAYRVAAQAFASGCENRVLILSDGVANLGNLAADDILAKVSEYREQGVTCSVFGFGIGTYDDVMLETLANKGDGVYSFIDSEDEARRVFVDDLAATLNTIASDVKIQVEFDPERVKRYRQIGYENRQLEKEDFRNDAVDAGEVGSGQSVTALYEVELRPRIGARDDRPHARFSGKARGTEPIAVVRMRYRRTDNGQTEEVDRAITNADVAPRFDDTDARFRLAACVAEFAEILRRSPFATGSEYEEVATTLRLVALEVNLDKRVQELLRLVQNAGGMSRGASE